jgi:hypothetical protein
MSAPAPCRNIRAARANVRLATAICGTADIRGLQDILILLEGAAAEMSLAEAAVRDGMVDEGDSLRQETLLLKREIVRMVSVVDGCAALHRGLAVRLGCASLTYTPRGVVDAAAPISAIAAYEMQG